VLVGGTAKLPGLAETTREVMQLPARVGSWKHIKKVVDGLDNERFAPAVGLMLMDMILGPAQHHQHGSFEDSQPGFLSNLTESISGVIKRVRRR
jgi:cell division ATPase FtsA